MECLSCCQSQIAGWRCEQWGHQLEKPLDLILLLHVRKSRASPKGSEALLHLACSQMMCQRF